MHNALIYIVIALCVSTVWAGTDSVAVADSQAVTAKAVRPVGTAVPELFFDDMALVQSSKVLYCELGLVIRNRDGGEVSVVVHDAKGRSVVSREFGEGAGTINMALSDIPRGVYVYTVRMADSVYTRPFVVTH